MIRRFSKVTTGILTKLQRWVLPDVSSHSFPGGKKIVAQQIDQSIQFGFERLPIMVMSGVGPPGSPELMTVAAKVTPQMPDAEAFSGAATVEHVFTVGGFAIT